MTGKRKFQRMFDRLYHLSLIGMNIGAGNGDPRYSGEKYALEYINNSFKSMTKIIVFDVGANVGLYTIMLKEVFSEKADIYSFEPKRKTFNKLQSNVGDKTRIHLYNFGFGNENAKSVLYSDSDESSGASVHKRKLDHFNINMNQSEEIEIKTVDSFCEDHKIEHIHLLKLDVEGHELKVLEGTSKMLQSGSIDFIQFEFGCNVDSRTYFQDFYYLLNDNYKIYRVLQDGLYQINQYKETYEIFVFTTYLAEKK